MFVPLSTALLLLQGPAAAPAAPTGPAGPRDRAELRTFVDALVSEQLKQHGIPGLAIAVVKDGEVWLAEGYGVADLETQEPVRGDSTIFALGSVSKVFTATAVMKLVQDGRVRLDEDVNRYLKGIQIADDGLGPVTLAHLLTHSAGFDEPYAGVFSPPGGPPVLLHTYLASIRPIRVRPPGQLVSYSNLGIALAGEVVEEVAGVPFERFVAENILEPLGMEHSLFGTPPAEMGTRATGYMPRNGTRRPVGTKHLRNILVPAASLHSTARDMAAFLLEHLGAPSRVLGEATRREMQERRIAFHPAFPGVTYGLFEHFHNGRRGLMHDGDWEGFASRLFFFPEDGVGLFVTFNTWNAVARAAVLERFLDHYYPAPETPSAPRVVPPSTEDLDRFEGAYDLGRFPQHSPFKLLKLVARIKVTRLGETLWLSSGGTLPNMVELPEMVFGSAGPLLFERRDGRGFIAFQTGPDGGVTHLRIEVPDIKVTGSMLFERTPWYGVARLQVGLMLLIGGVLLVGVLWPLVWLIRAARRRTAPTWPGERTAHSVAATAGLLALAFPLAFVLTLSSVEVSGPHLLHRAALALPFLVAATLPLLAYFCIRAWRCGAWSLVGRLQYTLFVGAGIGYLALLHYWNLIGYCY